MCSFPVTFGGGLHVHLCITIIQHKLTTQISQHEFHFGNVGAYMLMTNGSLVASLSGAKNPPSSHLQCHFQEHFDSQLSNVFMTCKTTYGRMLSQLTACRYAPQLRWDQNSLGAAVAGVMLLHSILGRQCQSCVRVIYIHNRKSTLDGAQWRAEQTDVMVVVKCIIAW